MAKNKIYLGRLGFKVAGAWQKGSYERRTLVFQAGQTYISKHDGAELDPELDDKHVDWDIFCMRGESVYQASVRLGLYEGTELDFYKQYTDAIANANNATENAEKATVNAIEATKSANTATKEATEATTAANKATREALGAKNLADTAASEANTATLNAKNAVKTAEATIADAEKATKEALSAAGTATTSASSALKSAKEADTATAQANTARDEATAAANSVAKAIQGATEATKKATSATALATSATEAANTATEQANTARDEANTARDAAKTATTQANTATTEANTARDEANAAATKATEATANMANELAKKVDKVEGRQLSEENYTKEDMDTLHGLNKSSPNFWVIPYINRKPNIDTSDGTLSFVKDTVFRVGNITYVPSEIHADNPDAYLRIPLWNSEGSLQRTLYFNLNSCTFRTGDWSSTAFNDEILVGTIYFSTYSAKSFYTANLPFEYNINGVPSNLVLPNKVKIPDLLDKNINDIFTISRNIGELIDIKNILSGQFYKPNGDIVDGGSNFCAYKKIDISNYSKIAIKAYSLGNASILVADENDKIIYNISEEHASVSQYFVVDIDTIPKAMWLLVSNYNVEIPCEEVSVIAVRLRDSILTDLNRLKEHPALFALDNINVRDTSKKALDSISGYVGLDLSEHKHHKYLTLVHASDCHGDEKRFIRMINFVKETPNVYGAIITGDFNESDYSDKGFEKLYVAHYADTTKPIMPCLGNHDMGFRFKKFGNTLQAVDNRFINPYVSRFDGVKGDGGYYYKDFEQFKIRLIVLNEYDMPRIDNGDTWKYDLWNRYLSQAQIDWFINALSTMSDGYSVVICFHQQIDKINAYDNEFKGTQIGLKNVGNLMEAQEHIIQDIVDAFIDKGTLNKTYKNTLNAPSSDIPDVTINVNFSGKKGTFICYLNGHEHWDVTGQSSVSKNKQVNINVTNNSVSKYQEYDDLCRLDDTDTQDVFNVIAFDTDRRKIRLLRIGADVSVQMTRRLFCSIDY